MIVFLLLIIAILLFILSKVLKKSADKIDSSVSKASPKIQEDSPKPKISFWDSYQKANPVLAEELLKITKGKIANLSDKDVRETISSFAHTAKTNSLQSYEETFQYILKKMVDYLDQSYPQIILGVLDNVIKEEVKQTGKKSTNTMSFYIKSEIKTIIENKLKAMSPKDLFKYRIKEALQQVSEKYEWNYEREGYDSPLAQEIVTLMRRMLNNETLMMRALLYGYSDSFSSIIIDEMESFVSENCNTSLDVAIDYHDNKQEFKNPYKRCPNCGSLNISEIDPEEDEYWCKDCKHDWHPHLMK